MEKGENGIILKLLETMTPEEISEKLSIPTEKILKIQKSN